MEPKYNIDFFTTSTSFKPNLDKNIKNSNERYYHHKNLDPNKNLWGKEKIIYVRNSDGIDYIIKFIEEGEKIALDNPNYKWKYRAKYIILRVFPKVKERARNIPAKLKKELLLKQKDKCWLCNDEFNDENTYEIDHIIEWSKGGLTEIDNLQALCKNSCHWIKTLALKKEKKFRIDDNYRLKYDFMKSDHENSNIFLIHLIEKIKNIHVK